MKCDNCGINFEISNSFRSFPIIWPLFLLGDVFTKHFCCKECENRYYYSKGKKPPLIIKKFFIWLFNILLTIIITAIIVTFLYAIVRN